MVRTTYRPTTCVTAHIVYTAVVGTAEANGDGVCRLNCDEGLNDNCDGNELDNNGRMHSNGNGDGGLNGEVNGDGD